MLPFNELARTQEFWMTNAQNNLHGIALNYAVTQKWPIQFNKQLSEHLGIGRVKASQIIDGNFNGTLAELIEYSLKLGAVPFISFDSLDNCINNHLAGNNPYLQYKGKK